MKSLDIQKPVKLIHPQEGEEMIIYQVINLNETTNRCIIEPLNLPNWNKSLLPHELVSINDIENV